MVVQALKKCNVEQRSLLEDFYGRQEPDSVQKIKSLFKDLDLEGEYRTYEDTKFQKIMSEINGLEFEKVESGQLTREVQIVLKNYAQKIFKRNK